MFVCLESRSRPPRQTTRPLPKKRPAVFCFLFASDRLQRKLAGYLQLCLAQFKTRPAQVAFGT
jgi:hypothetical protein